MATTPSAEQTKPGEKESTTTTEAEDKVEVKKQDKPQVEAAKTEETQAVGATKNKQVPPETKPEEKPNLATKPEPQPAEASDKVGQVEPEAPATPLSPELGEADLNKLAEQISHTIIEQDKYQVIRIRKGQLVIALVLLLILITAGVILSLKLLG